MRERAKPTYGVHFGLRPVSVFWSVLLNGKPFLLQEYSRVVSDSELSITPIWTPRSSYPPMTVQVSVCCGPAQIVSAPFDKRLYYTATVRVPNVFGLNLNSATDSLEETWLKRGKITQGPMSPLVVEQSPRADVLALTGSPVDLIFTRGGGSSSPTGALSVTLGFGAGHEVATPCSASTAASTVVARPTSGSPQSQQVSWPRQSMTGVAPACQGTADFTGLADGDYAIEVLGNRVCTKEVSGGFVAVSVRVESFTCYENGFP